MPVVTTVGLSRVGFCTDLLLSVALVQIVTETIVLYSSLIAILFRKNVSLPSSGSRNRPREEAGGKESDSIPRNVV
jgi:hypothetical protein